MIDEAEEPHTRVKNIIKNKLINCFMVTEVFFFPPFISMKAKRRKNFSEFIAN
jgi:hypothetical protein